MTRKSMPPKVQAAEVGQIEQRGVIRPGKTAADQSEPRRMLNEKQVLDLVPFKRTTLYRMEKAGRFPRSTYISPNRRVWFADEIVAWQNAVDEFDPRRGRGKGRRHRDADIRPRRNQSTA